MKLSLRHLFLCAIATGCFSLTPAFAEPSASADTAADKTADRSAAAPAATPAEPSSTVAAPAEQSPAVTPPEERPAAAAATPTPAEPAAVSPEPAPTSAEPSAGRAETQPKVDTPAPATEASPKVESSEAPQLRRLDNDENTGSPKSQKEKVHEHLERAHQRAAAARANAVGRDIVNIFGDSNLPKDEKVDNVVAIFGSATAEGETTDSVVAVFGNSRATGPVGDAVVAVLGDSEVTGTVGDSTVVVLGNLTINSHVRGDVVAVLGDITFGPAAEVGGDVVCVGGTVTKSPGTVLHHGVQNVGFGHSMHGAAGLKAWVRQCFMYGRPLAFGPNLMWAWWIALGLLAFYLVLALLFGRGVNKCVETFEQRPGYSILTALLTVLLAPVAIVLLVFTGIGIAVIPFVAAALFFATLFGKAVMFAWIGRRFTKFFGSGHPALAVLIGGVIALLLYTVPVVGFIVYKLLGWIGLGVVIYTLILSAKREKPAVPPIAPGAIEPMAGMPVPPVTPVDPAAASVAAAPGLVAPVVMAPPVMSAMTLPRAGFWIRLAALLLDVIIVGMLCSLLSGVFSFGSHVHIKADLLPALAIYGALMWKLRGSTVGGIVCSLRVVRLDDRPIDWGTAIVRALSCFLSLFVLGFGFIWVVFDDQRQSWHDKIAGTTVVRVPKGVSLV